MSIVTNIINRARITLADTNATRFTNESLVLLMNEGIETFVELTNTLRQTLYVELEENVSIYDISDYALMIERVEYLGKIIPAKTIEEMDQLSLNWRTDTGEEVLYTVFNKLNKGQIRIYPLLTNGVSDIVSQNQVYGGLIDVTVSEGLFNLPSISQAEVSVPKYLVVSAIKKPDILTFNSTDEDYELDTSFNKAISAYITAIALRNDESEQNRAFGNEQIQIFNTYVDKAMKDSSRNFNTALPRKVKYNNGFN